MNALLAQRQRAEEAHRRREDTQRRLIEHAKQELISSAMPWEMCIELRS